MVKLLKLLARTMYQLAESKELARTARVKSTNYVRTGIWLLALVGGFLWLTWAAWDMHPVAGKAMAGICTLLLAGQARFSGNDSDEYRADPILRSRNDGARG